MSNHDDGGFKIIGAAPEIGADPTLEVVGVDLHQNAYEREIRSEPVQERRANDTLRDERESTPISITLMKIDKTIFKHLTNFIKPTVDDDGNQRLVPVRYANAERWQQVREDGVLRDAAGRVQTPIILFRRTGIRRNLLTNPVNKHIDRTYQTGWNRHFTYDKFNVLNRIIPSKKLVSVTIPDYVDLTYDFLLWTDYIEQMNPLIETLNFEMDSYWGERGEFKFRVRTEDYTVDTEVPATGDRYVKATFQMKVSAYLLPDSMMTVDKGEQPTDRIRFSNKKVVIVQEIDGTGVAPRRVVESWPAAGSGSGEL